MDKIETRPLQVAQPDRTFEPNSTVIQGVSNDTFAAERSWLSARWIASLIILFGLLDGLIWLRVLLKLMAANPANSFVKLIYQASAVFTWPFASLVENPTGGGMVVEITSIIGMITYSLICWSILQWIRIRRENQYPEEIDW